MIRPIDERWLIVGPVIGLVVGALITFAAHQASFGSGSHDVRRCVVIVVERAP